MIRLCVISEDTDTLFEWLNAVDPLRFHFSVECAATSALEVVEISRRSSVHVWVGRVDDAVRAQKALTDAGVSEPRFVVIASGLAEVSSAVAKGFLTIVLANSSLWIFAAAVHSAKGGHPFLSPEILDVYRGGVTELLAPPVSGQIESLTVREIEIALHLIEGMSNSEISRKIFVSRPTVATHLLSIYRKLDCSNRTEVAVFALRNATMLRRALEVATGDQK